MTRLRLTSFVLAAALLAGCGQALPTKPKTKAGKATAMRPLATAPVLPGPGLAGAPVDGGKGASLLQQMRGTFEQISGFEGELTARTQGHYKQGQKVSELRKVTMGYKVLWSKPAKFRAEVTVAPDALMQGAAIATTDGVNLTARAKGLLSLIPIKIKANEPKLGNARNHTFDKFSPNAQIKRLIGASAVWTVVSETTTPEGAPMALVAIDNVPRLDGEITREILGVEIQSSIIRSLTAYAGETRATDYTFTRFRWNPKVSATSFEL